MTNKVLKSEDMQKVANVVRYLSVCMVERANSGHPGMPLGAADICTVLFTKFLNFSTKDPKWKNRDRFVLSAGHGSALLYSLFHLFGYKDVSMDDLKNFRQLHSKTAGHPEYGYLEAIETTTGPLGQGFANAVGMAIAQAKFEAEIDSDIINNYTYVLVGDGCLQEGISFEAAELAGHLGLSKLITLYDSNEITIDGKTSIAISSSTTARFEAHGWNVFECDGHNYTQIQNAIELAKKSTSKPSIIICQTKIGFASKKEGSEESHGSPLKADEIDDLAKNLGIDYQKFEVPTEVANLCNKITDENNLKYQQWLDHVSKSSKKPILEQYFNGYPKILDDELKTNKIKEFEAKTSSATRVLSGNVLSFLQQKYPNFIVGSADLAKSNCVLTKFAKAIKSSDKSGNYIHYGVREHAMAAISNGIFLYGGLAVACSTFFIFSDYLRPALRLSALMEIGVLYILTHDSIMLGEDGPTHQPVEHLSALRIIPNTNVFRPCDAIETWECYQLALNNNKTPSVFALSRQGVKILREVFDENKNLSSKGAYFITNAKQNAKYHIFASGAEVELAIQLTKKLNDINYGSVCVSVPCLDLFEKQSNDYKKQVLGDSNIVKVFIEAANLMSYYKYYNPNKDILIDITTFGLSGKDKDLAKHFGYNVDDIIKKIGL